MFVVRPMIAAAACLLATGAVAAGRPTDAEIAALASKYSAATIADRQDIHRNAELSNRDDPDRQPPERVVGDERDHRT